ncbi:MAG: hypothetical protein Kow00111_18640 [Thermincola ferriacetica]
MKQPLLQVYGQSRCKFRSVEIIESQLVVSPGSGLFLTLTQGRVGRVLRLPFGSDCAHKTAAGQAGSSRMSEDGEGRREVRRST